MVFNSYIFLLLFLPCLILSYYILVKVFDNRKQYALSGLLLIASAIFYSYTNTDYLLLLYISILINYLLYCTILKRKEKHKTTKGILIFGIIINFSILLYFKYINFAIQSINIILGSDFAIREISIPLGISFITFQQIAFLVDVYRGEISGCSFCDYSLFITYFPHVSSGPILLHGDFLHLLGKVQKLNWDKFATGIYFFVMGLGKKVIIADTFAKAVDWGYANIAELNSTSAIFVSVAYSIQIYFDFSGYSDMAIGISRMLQLDLPINFNSPYKAKNILEFWKRWHMTLTRFLTKYLYIPLGGNRKGKVRTYINTLIVFLCSGIWHGASWTFIIWGLLHGIFMVFTKLFQKQIERIPNIINHVGTLFFVNFTWILFRSGTFDTFRQIMRAILQNKWGGLNENISSAFRPSILNLFGNINMPNWIFPVMSTMMILAVVLKCENVQEQIVSLKYSKATAIWVVLIAVVSILSLSGVNTFIYSIF